MLRKRGSHCVPTAWILQRGCSSSGAEGQGPRRTRQAPNYVAPLGSPSLVVCGQAVPKCEPPDSVSRERMIRRLHQVRIVEAGNGHIQVVRVFVRPQGKLRAAVWAEATRALGRGAEVLRPSCDEPKVGCRNAEPSDHRRPGGTPTDRAVANRPIERLPMDLVSNCAAEAAAHHHDVTSILSHTSVERSLPEGCERRLNVKAVRRVAVEPQGPTSP